MRKFLRLLFSSLLSKVLFLSGLASLGAGFLGVGIPNWVTVTIFLGAYLYASYDVFRKQEREITTLQREVEQKKSETEKLELVILPKRSSFIPSITTDRQNKPTDAGTFLEFNLSVENKGNRNAHITRFDLWLDQTPYRKLGRGYKTHIRSRTTSHSVGQDWLIPPGKSSKTVGAGKLIEGKLLFFVPDVISPERKEISCRLEIYDTENNHVEQDFVLQDVNQ